MDAVLSRGEARAQQQLWQREAWWLGIREAIAPRMQRPLRRAGSRLLMMGRATAPLALACHRPGLVITVVESEAEHWAGSHELLARRGIAAVHGDVRRLLAASVGRRVVYTTPPDATALATPPREDVLVAVRALEGESPAESAALMMLMGGAARHVIAVEIEPGLAAWWRLAVAGRAVPTPPPRSATFWKEALQPLRGRHQVRSTVEGPLRLVEITEREKR